MTTAVIIVTVWLVLIVLVVWGWARFMAPMRRDG